ncbi:hypothetical protein AB0J42_37325 [Nonomuraea sp. NPDC049649]|uniref:hypothetical protein n=1 Tax=Nonomuraea sp. NPDC049649 TaxID=3155776 RepID=UPI00343F4FC9
MINKSLLALFVQLKERLDRHTLDPERGASTLEWVIIAAVVFLLALAAGAKITQVVNDQLAKIG